MKKDVLRAIDAHNLKQPYSSTDLNELFMVCINILPLCLLYAHTYEHITITYSLIADVQAQNERQRTIHNVITVRTKY